MGKVTSLFIFRRWRKRDEVTHHVISNVVRNLIFPNVCESIFGHNAESYRTDSSLGSE